MKLLAGLFLAGCVIAWTPLEGTTPPPNFSDVSQRTAADVVAYVRGELPGYMGGEERLFSFSPSDILETMDTVVVDRSWRADVIHETIAQGALDTLTELYPDGWILLPLDAGHGGETWDPGSNGTEADHTRAVVEAIERLAPPRVLVRRIYNDELSDDVGLPRALTKHTVSTILTRQARAAMLAEEARAWMGQHFEPVHVHELSIHFNAGSGGAMVLHQGDTVDESHRELSVVYAKAYLDRVIPALNETRVLPVRLRRWAVTGLHDDVMMYRPAYFTAEDTRGITLRYGGLQGRGGYLSKYAPIVAAHSRYPPHAQAEARAWGDYSVGSARGVSRWSNPTE